MADALSPDAAMTPDVRRTLHNRARGEVASNSYAKGMVLAIAGDCVGTGPRLQLLTEDNETNRIVEQAFAEWATVVNLAEKLRTMRMAKATDGEAFAVLVNNPTLNHPVKLDILPVEAERVTSPPEWMGDLNTVGGIELNRHGNPTAYHVMKDRPGEITLTGVWFERFAADTMIHRHRPDGLGNIEVFPKSRPPCRCSLNFDVTPSPSSGPPTSRLWQCGNIAKRGF